MGMLLIFQEGPSNVSNSSSSSVVNQDNQSQNVAVQVTANPTINIQSISGSTSVEDIISALTAAISQGLADSLVTAILQASGEKVRRRR